MSVSYNGLWEKLKEKKMLKKDLAAELNISSATMAKMGKGEPVTLSTIEKICELLKCNIEDVVKFTHDEEEN